MCFAVLLMVTACQPGGSKSQTSVPIRMSSPVAREEAPDDIVPTPGSDAYRANVHEQGVENPWPPIETVEVQLGSGSNIVFVRYRNHIVTKTGETRNNILYMRKEGGFFTDVGLYSMNLYTTGMPSSLKLFREGGGGLPGTLVSVLVIEISQDAIPGQYDLEIGLEIKGRGYGTIPCTIEVIQ